MAPKRSLGPLVRERSLPDDGFPNGNPHHDRAFCLSFWRGERRNRWCARRKRHAGNCRGRSNLICRDREGRRVQSVLHSRHRHSNTRRHGGCDNRWLRIGFDYRRVFIDDSKHGRRRRRRFSLIYPRKKEKFHRVFFKIIRNFKWPLRCYALDGRNTRHQQPASYGRSLRRSRRARRQRNDSCHLARRIAIHLRHPANGGLGATIRRRPPD